MRRCGFRKLGGLSVSSRAGMDLNSGLSGSKGRAPHLAPWLLLEGQASRGSWGRDPDWKRRGRKALLWGMERWGRAWVPQGPGNNVGPTSSPLLCCPAL